MAPIIPYLSDSPSQLKATVAAVAEAGATHIAPIVLHLRTGARQWFMRWLGEHHPDLVPRYGRLYGSSAYTPKAFQSEITDTVHRLAERFQVGKLEPRASRLVRLAHPEVATAPAPPAQLRLI